MDVARSRSQGPGMLAMGAWLATRGLLAKVSLGLAGLAAFASVIAALEVRGRPGVLALPSVAAPAIAWLVGATLAFGASFQALRRDRDEGVLALARARGVAPGAYVRGRVGGLALVLLVSVGGATLVAGFAATAASVPHAAALRPAIAGLVYAVIFAVTFAPLALAALGTGTRSSGYMVLLAILIVPELLSPWTRAVLPAGWGELTSIPAALEAVRVGVETGGGAALHAARALVGLAAVVVASVFVVNARVAADGVDSLDPPARGRP